jgi:hypothetical protein
MSDFNFEPEKDFTPYLLPLARGSTLYEDDEEVKGREACVLVSTFNDAL